MHKNILLIDDDIDELFILKEALSEAHETFQCVHAETVLDGIDMLKSVSPDFIFLDINMPVIDGFEGLKMIHQLAITQNIPVVMYSTAVNEEINRKAILMGAAASVRKTGSIQTLAKALRSLFDASKV